MQVSYGAPGTPKKSSALRAAAASFAGAVMDWYDFFVYGLVAALTFPKLFFPANNPATGTLLTFATFGVGFVARPLGGIVFGHFGDKIGRKAMLVLTLLLMGLGTLFLAGACLISMVTGLLYGGPQAFRAPEYLENEA